MAGVLTWIFGMLFLIAAAETNKGDQQHLQCSSSQFVSWSKGRKQCIDCYCNDVTTRCRQAMYFSSKIELNDVTKVKAVSDGLPVHENGIYYSSMHEVILGNVDDLGSTIVYWILPKDLLGNQIFSYGGYLSFTVFYDVSTKSSPYHADDVIIKGSNGFSISHKNKKLLRPKVTLEYRLQILEGKFHMEDGSKASRKTIMKVLGNVKEVLIRATYAKNSKITILNSVSLGTAVPYYTRNGRATYVEHCLCPEGYHGLSCESCQRGYTKWKSASGEEICIRCQCNRHSLECSPDTGICMNCQDNTMGDHCEKCKPGYYGIPGRGTTDDCKRCACPLAIKSNQFSPTCDINKFGSVECGECKQGYKGVDCGECAIGYTGNPRSPGGKCFKTLTYADRMPRISVTPRRRTDPLQYRATFKCLVDGTGPFHVTWSRKDARPLPVGRSRVLTRDSTWILIISSLRVADEGQYVCTARNQFGIASYGVRITVYEHRVSPIKVNVTPKSLRITEGSSALFLCSVNTNLITHTRSWSRDGYRLLPDTAKVHDGTLAFHNARREDTGVYTCSASNQVTVDSATVVLSVGVLIKPQISVWPIRQTVNIGRPAKFHCSAAGFPKPELFWSKVTKEESRGRYSFGSGGVINIDAVRIEDEGEYICTARNNGGKVTRKAILYVRAPDRRLSISVYPLKIKARVGDAVTFRCASSGQPEPSIQWSSAKGKQPKTDSGLMTFAAIDWKDSGTYVCTASNPYGALSAKVKLKVVKHMKQPLTVVVHPETIEILEGDSAVLHCNVSGVLSTLTWSKAAGLLADNHIIERYMLNITKARVTDEGTYFCTARNDDVVVQRSVTVTIKRNVQPKVVIRPHGQRTVPIGAKVHFRCIVTAGQPIKDILWYKSDGELIVDGLKRKNRSDDLVLAFNKVDKQDEGQYFCAIVNNVGFAKATAKLKVSGKPNIALSPRGIYNASMRDDVIFECKATGYPLPEVKWLLPRGKDEIGAVITSWQGYGRVEMKVNENIAGKYVCIASNEEGNVSDSIQVQLSNQTAKPFVTLHSSVVKSIVGDHVSVTCEPTGIPTPEFAWVKLRKGARSIAMSQKKVFVIEDVQISDEGTYACRAWNRFGVAEARTRLNVSVLPVVTVSPSSVVVLNGRSFTLRCKATGYPLPIVNWTRVNNALPSLAKIFNGKLEVTNARPEHAGTYECVTKNSGGTVVKSANVTVLDPPKIVWSSKEENLAKLGDNITFSCNVSGFPKPKLSWYKDQFSIAHSGQSELRLENLTSDSQGQFRCMATNLAGQAEAIFSLAIEEVPTANILEDKGTSLKVVPVGRNVILTCVTSGIPEPVVQWKKINGKLPNGFIVEGGKLNILNVKVEDAGTFRCSAFNPVGHVHADIRLFVQGAPTVQVSPKEMQVQVGKEARISCTATGMPVPTISWYKVNGSISRHYLEKGYLVIPKVRNMDAGDYMCRAVNNEGTAEGRVKMRTTDFLPRFSEDGQSYIIYGKILGALYRTKIEISFRPEIQDGLLLYNGRYNGDFISLSLRKGFVVFQYNLGSGPAFIQSSKAITLFDWHTVTAYRDGLYGTLSVDSESVVYGKSKGKYTGLNLNGDLFIGGHANLKVVKKQTSQSRGYVGCISQIVIADKAFEIAEDSLMMVGIADCNICLTQPCKNKGICLASASHHGYKCDCPAGFAGRSCSKRVEQCFPGACGTDGVCTDTEGKGFKCKCPIGKYGARCEIGKSIKTPSFTNHSFMIFPGIKGSWEELHIQLKFKPRSLNGILLFNGGIEKSVSTQDFIMVRLISGHVQFEFDSGSGLAIITHSQTIALDAWNLVDVERYRKHGSILMNGKFAEKGASKGDSIALNLGPKLHIGGRGGIEAFPADGHVVSQPDFDGCIKELVINGKSVDLVKDFMSYEGITDCHSKFSPCLPPPCKNNATCLVSSAVTYECRCPARYYGRHCEKFTSRCGSVDDCVNGGVCARNHRNDMYCQCKVGFTGKACQHAIQIQNEALFKGDGYLQFPRNILRKVELTSLQFDLRTRANDGLVFWFGEKKDGTSGPDFLTVGLKNGFLEVSYELGSGLALVLTKEPMNDGHWHTVKITRSARKASLYIDGIKIGHTESSGINTRLDIEAPMFFGGGKDVTTLTRQKFKASYHGCIANVLVEDYEIALQEMAEDGRNVHHCTEDSI